MFPSGFLDEVETILKKFKVEYEYKDKRNKLPKWTKKDIKHIFDLLKHVSPRPYQKKTILSLLENNCCGVANMPTGSGKTLIINLTIFVLDKLLKKKQKCIIMTHGSSLLSQLKESIQKFQKEEVGIISEGVWNTKRITVASVDTLTSRLVPKQKKKNAKMKAKKNQAENFLLKADMIFSDEAHHSPAKTFKVPFLKAKNASFRIGTTATYIRNGEPLMNLHAVTGKVIFKRSLSWMIDRGYLAKPTIILVEFGDKWISEDDEWYEQYKKGISANALRNGLISNIAVILNNYNLSSVIFVNEIGQGENITMQMEGRGYPTNKIAFLQGRDDLESIRKPTLKAFTTGKIRNLIATKILNEGIDFPEANAGIRAMARKYEGGIIQQLGRILRKVKEPLAKDIDRETLQRVFWVDICDTHSPKLADWTLQRIRTYEKEKAFDIRYVSSIKEMKRVLDEQIKDVKIISEEKTSLKRRVQK
jgi:superfamily II DNA or RNA helicase